MRALDTNVLLRLLVRTDPAQSMAAFAAIEEGAWVSHLVLAECIWVLGSAYNRSLKEQIEAIEMLLDQRELIIQDADVVATALDHFKRKPRLGFSDCLILEIARKAGHSPLLTFDRELARLPGVRKC
jgi:predicted nucleic-acid-binding protein